MGHLPYKIDHHINFWVPLVLGHKKGSSSPPDLLALAVRILQILNFTDISGISTSSIMLFHNVDPKLVHRLSQGQQIWTCGGSRTNICGLGNPSLECKYSTVLYCTVLRANGSPDSLFGCKLDSDPSEVGFNNFHVGNHITMVREHRQQFCNCRTSFLAAYGTNSTGKLNDSLSGTNIL